MIASSLVLVIDSSTPILFLGLLEQGQPKDTHIETLDRKQSEMMVPNIMSFLDRHHLKLGDLQAIVVGDGPGSFTGVRLALTLVKTLALLKPMAIYPISSLQLFAIDPLSAVWMDARGERMYLGVYEKNIIHVAPMILEMRLKKMMIDAYPKATWLTPALACLKPNQILEHVASLMMDLKPLKDIHQLNPRYLKDIL
jgi:tRNA threonylcarbamoyl adenosine modification protein YeaZ